MKKIFTKSLSMGLMLALIAANNGPIFVYAQEQTGTTEEAQENATKVPKTIDLLVGDVEVIVTKNLTRIAVTNPDMVDIADAKSEKVTIVGKKPGQTDILIWDTDGKHSVVVRVAAEDLEILRARIQETLDKAQIKDVSLDKSAYEGKIVLYGSITKEAKSSLDRVMEPFGGKIINLVKEDISEDLIQIDAQIVEVSTNLSRELGIDWTNGSGTSGSSTSTTGTSGATGGTLQPSYGEQLPAFDGSIGDLFKVGKFSRTSALQANLNVLISEGKAKVLSKPRLVVKSGKEASFLVGGEIPIQNSVTTSGGAGTTTSSVTFKQYGVNMTVTPTIREGKIDINLNVKITDIDQANKVGNDVAYTSREAQTQLFLDDKQTIVLAGLIKHNEANTVKKVAFLGDIPLVGLLFRSHGTPRTDTEMIISLTPRILKQKKIATEQIKMPTKQVDDFQNKFLSGSNGFEKESLSEAKVEPKVVTVEKVVAKSETKQPAVLAASQVPSIIVLDYVRAIQVRISQAISYPKEALDQNWEGSVKLRLRILKDGSLADCDLLESSGHDIFDVDAQKTTKALAPFLSFPEEMQQDDIVVTVPIIYNRHTSSKNTQAVMPSY